jgi:acetyl-CoA carboxylase carboxyl transferase subunit alpha
MSAIDNVLKSREKNRISPAEIIDAIFTDFFEMHGDRKFADDSAIKCGVARLEGVPVSVIAINKGKDTKEKVKNNFGSPHPEGYRKALRIMKQAEKFNRPIICLIDTAGAYCGIGAEERGQGQAIAENLCEMMRLNVPVISILTGEGGSGGALALAVANEVWMLKNSIYSVISPEGCASILWKDSKKIEKAANCLKLTSDDLLSFNIIDKIIDEEGDFFINIKIMLTEKIKELRNIDKETLKQDRYNKFRRIGY